MSTFVILIQENDHAESFELALNKHNINFNCEIIKDKLELIYEFTMDTVCKKYVLSIIENNHIEILEFISN
jgi:hypothetical protein